MSVAADGPLVATTGNWPAGVGITLRADALGVLFAVFLMSVAMGGAAQVWHTAQKREKERELLFDPETYQGRSTASARLPGALIDGMSFTL